MECGIRQQELQIIKSIMALRFCKSEHPAAQPDFSWRCHSPNNQPLHSTSHQTWKGPSLTSGGKSWHQPTLQACCRWCVADDMAKSIQIARVTSSNPTHSAKISAVNCKQLSNNIIDPLLFYGTYGLALSRRSHSGQSIQIWVLEVLWHPKNRFWSFILSQNWYSALVVVGARIRSKLLLSTVE